jgi:hypothetical protein
VAAAQAEGMQTVGHGEGATLSFGDRKYFLRFRQVMFLPAPPPLVMMIIIIMIIMIVTMRMIKIMITMIMMIMMIVMIVMIMMTT